MGKASGLLPASLQQCPGEHAGAAPVARQEQGEMVWVFLGDGSALWTPAAECAPSFGRSSLAEEEPGSFAEGSKFKSCLHHREAVEPLWFRGVVSSH